MAGVGAGDVGLEMRDCHVKRGDTVVCTTGVSAGKTGKVLAVMGAKNRVLVEGLNLVKKTLRKSQENPKGGIVDKERAVAASNVLLFCPSCKRGVRTALVKDGEKKSRNCKGCGHSFDG